METEKKMWRTKSNYLARNVRIMKIGEPKAINDELTLCDFSFIDQPGNEKDEDAWVRVNGSNGLAERIFNSEVGDRVNVSGKPTFRAYLDKEGKPRVQVEIKYPNIDFLTPPDVESAQTRTDNNAPEPEEEIEEVEKRKPGRPKKTLPFQG